MEEGTARQLKFDLDKEVENCIRNNGTLAEKKGNGFMCTIDVDQARYGYCRFSDIRYIRANANGAYCSCGLKKPMPGFKERGREDYPKT